MSFYDVGEQVHPVFFWAEPSSYDRLDALLLRKEPPKRCPVVFPVKTGMRAGDAISCNVWSERMVNVLRTCKATGWSSVPAHVTRQGKRIPGYRLVHVSGRGGRLDFKRSRASYSKEGLLQYDGVYMIEDEWDGSDMFLIPELCLAVFAVERVAKALLDARLTNVSVRPARERWM